MSYLAKLLILNVVKLPNSLDLFNRALDNTCMITKENTMKKRAEIEAAIREISSEIEQMEDDAFEDVGRHLLSFLQCLKQN